VRNILDFPGHFSPRAEIATLERNYRSTKPILAAANAVMDLAKERFTKNLWSERASAERPRLVSVRDEADQARYVAEKILENRERGILLKTQAVLFRASHHSAPLEIELTRRNIPFVKFGGLKFLEAAHIKDVLAFLRWAENARDRVAGFRVIQLLPGVGPAKPRVFLTALPKPPMRCKPSKPSLHPPRLLNHGHPSSKRSALWVANRPDGLRNWTSFAAGTCRLWSAAEGAWPRCTALVPWDTLLPLNGGLRQSRPLGDLPNRATLPFQILDGVEIVAGLDRTHRPLIPPQPRLEGLGI
jgi:hypothetical protein